MAINFDDEVSNADDENFEGTQGAIETVELELQLREAALSVVERNRAEPSEITLAFIE